MKALIDGDICVYMIGFTTQGLDQNLVPARVDQTVQLILDAVQADSHQLYLTMDGKDGFRYKVCPTYKGNRKADKPEHYDFIRTYLIEQWGAKLVSNIEADDAMAIEQMSWISSYNNHVDFRSVPPHDMYETMICSLDKDLDMVPGMHYRWPIVRLGKEVSPARFYCVDEPDATRHFYWQLIVGDTSDNIYGIKGAGPKAADKLLAHLDDEQEMFDVVRELYNDDKRFLMNGQLLWIMREVDDYWEKHWEGFK